MKLVQDTRLIPGILTGLLGAFLLWQGSQMPHSRGWASSPGLFPIIIGAVLVVLAVLLLIERATHKAGIKEKEENRDAEDIAPEPATDPFLTGDLTAVLAILVGLAAYIGALAILPYEPVTFVFLCLGMVGFGSRSPLHIVLGAGAFTLVIVLLFTQVLGTLIPGTSSLLDSFLR